MLSCNIWFRYATSVTVNSLGEGCGYTVMVKLQSNLLEDELTFYTKNEEVAEKLREVVQAEIDSEKRL